MEFNPRIDVNLQQLACFFDPRHKSLMADSSAEVRTAIREEAQKRVELKHRNKNTGASSRGRTVLDVLLGETEEAREQEFDKYLTEPQIDQNLDPAMWWSTGGNNLPNVTPH